MSGDGGRRPGSGRSWTWWVRVDDRGMFFPERAPGDRPVDGGTRRGWSGQWM
ncbi:hypothetical protein ACFFX0_32135 [Citricoccus parietis]|uniref:Uncharacterized protein n=1 Tax=Citricoccus parietis TaxID=592307 RepID=A0ABV5G9F0_9MICC